ncbi:MAG: peptide-methionine (S)-S-oxide reductase MsrA [Capsulimonadaceae bacterium]
MLVLRPLLAAVALVIMGIYLAGLAGGLKAGAEQETMTNANTLPHTAVQVPPGKEVATLAGGCFWCTEAIFQELKGVDSTEPGYAGGSVPNPTYQQVCTETTGHAETVQIVFDPNRITYAEILRIFFTVHDPTTLDRQGADIGSSYRSVIFTHGPDQERVAHEVIDEVNKAHIWPDPIVTQVVPFTNFYPAEGYHHDYFEQNPDQYYCQLVIAPKVLKFREKWASMLK